MKKLLVMVTVLAMCATSALCAEGTPKKKGPSSTKAYERASDKASFKRNIEPKNKKIKKEAVEQKKAVKEETKTKKKGFLWW